MQTARAIGHRTMDAKIKSSQAWSESRRVALLRGLTAHRFTAWRRPYGRSRERLDGSASRLGSILRIAFTLAMLAICWVTIAPSLTANAATVQSASLTIENRALNWAETQTGAPYVWGGVGPYWSGYDCSGLVVAAFAREGVYLPHNTVQMIYSGKLVRVWKPQRGDLAFFGPVGAPYHVEFVTVWRDTSFGSHTYGEPVGWAQWGGWWQPSAFYRVY